MNIPADIPSPDQENVYYSIKAMEAEFAKYFTQEKINILSPVLKEYYYPTFVFDDSNAPNSYQLSIYPKDGRVKTILLDTTGSVSMEKESVQPPVNPATPSVLEDNGSPVTLDPTFYSNAKLKSSDFFTSLQEDQNTKPGIELLLGVKYWSDLPYSKESEPVSYTHMTLPPILLV